jgi:hypothetical protein
MMTTNRVLLTALLAISLTACSGGTDPGPVRTDAPADPPAPLAAHPPSALPAALEPEAGSPAEAALYIRYYRTIVLTPEQERVKALALSAIPAPCCSNFSIATCCCPCNMAKAVWGFSHHLIAERDAGADEVQAAVEDWLTAANPTGFRGDACFVASGCQRPMKHDGCGGMDERTITE